MEAVVPKKRSRKRTSTGWNRSKDMRLIGERAIVTHVHVQSLVRQISLYWGSPAIIRTDKDHNIRFCLDAVHWYARKQRRAGYTMYDSVSSALLAFV